MPVMPICTCSTSSKWQWYMYVPGVVRPVEVGEVAADRHRDRQLRHAVEERDRVDEAVPVHGVAVEQVRPTAQAQVGQA